MTELVLFASTFLTVFALGFQQLNVEQRRYGWAFITSYAIGGASLALYRYLPEPTFTQILAYLNGGALGIVASMKAHEWYFGRARRMRGLLAKVESSYGTDLRGKSK